MSRSLAPRVPAASLVALLLSAAPSLAQTTYTWTGGGPTNGWSEALNWSVTSGPGSPPPQSDLNNTFLVLTGNTQTTNVLNQNLSANTLTFDANAGSFVVGAGVVGGNPAALTLGTGGIATLGNGNQTIQANLAAGAATTWFNTGTGVLTLGGAVNTGGFQIAAGGTGSVVASGVISGTGGLTVAGPGTLTLTGNNTYTGQTNVVGGTLSIGPGGAISGMLDSSAVGVIGTGTLSVAAGGSVSTPVIALGTGRVEGTGSLNIVSLGTIDGNGQAGGIVRAGVNGVGALAVSDLVLGTGATLSFRITSAGTPAGANTGGSSAGSPTNPTSNNFLNVTGTLIPADLTDFSTYRFVIDGTGTTFTPGQSYSYRVGRIGFDVLGDFAIGAEAGEQVQFSTIGIANPSGFTFTFSSVGGGLGDPAVLYLNVAIATPVPEPATVLGLATGAMGLGGLVRRRFRREAAPTAAA